MSQGWHKVYGKDDVLIHCRQVKSDLYMYGIKKDQIVSRQHWSCFLTNLLSTIHYSYQYYLSS